MFGLLSTPVSGLVQGESMGIPKQAQGGLLGDPMKVLNNPLLQIGLSLLANNTSRNFGQNLGRGGLQAMQNIGQLQQQSQFNKFRDMQMKQIEMQNKRDEEERAKAEQMQKERAGLFGDISAQYGVDPKVLSAYPEIGQDLVKQKLLPKAPKIGFTPSGVAYDENNPQLKLGESYAKQEDSGMNPNKPFMVVNGQVVPNKAYQDYELKKAQLSAPSSNVTVGFPKEQFKNERDLRNDFQGLPTTKAFKEVQTAYDQITTALKNPSAANDLAAATKFMKLLDPGSVVRESELGMAMEATGKLDRLGNYFNMLQTGQKLTPSQRKDFDASARELYKAAAGRYNEAAGEYQSMAKDYELNPERIAKPVQIDGTKQTKRPPLKGQVVNGWEFLGGNPADKNNWKQK